MFARNFVRGEILLIVSVNRLIGRLTNVRGDQQHTKTFEQTSDFVHNLYIYAQYIQNQKRGQW
jgi:hypothetical protein